MGAQRGLVGHQAMVSVLGEDVLTLAPLGVLLGMPFPLGLQIVSAEADALVAWGWGVNGFFTVIGTVSALILGMAFGFKAVLCVGAGCYLLAVLAINPGSTNRKHKHRI